MKIYHLLLFACIASLYACSEQRPAIVENPPFEAWNSTTLEIAKIEMNDSATIFHIDASFTPKQWIRIDSGTYIRESGGERTWPVTGAEGISLNSEFFMPESGQASFKLFFPPLPKDVKRLDFIESDCERCFKIWGIRLMPSDAVEMAAMPDQAPANDLPKMEYNPQITRFSGRIDGFNKEMVEKPEVIVELRDMITLEEQTCHLPVAPDGTFSGEAVVTQPGMVYFDTNVGTYLQAYLIPGKDINIVFDLKRLSRYQSKLRKDKVPSDSIYTCISGACFSAKEMNAIGKEQQINYMQIFAEVIGMTPEQYRNYMFNLFDKKLDNIKKSTCSEAVKAQMVLDCNTNKLSLLLNYNNFMSAAYRNAGKAQDFKPATLTIDYYSSFLKDFDERTLCNVVDMLRTVAAFALPDGQNKPVNARFTYFKEKIEPFVGDKTSFFDLAKAHFYADLLQEQPFSERQKSEVTAALASKPAYAKALLAASNKLEQQLAALKSSSGIVINSTPNVPDNQLFKTIISKYAGNVVLVDFWATWCGPCMQAHKSLQPIKDEMMGKGVVFLYITGETSPLTAWNKAIPDIHGEHFRLSDAQWDALCNEFGVSGIPSYLVIDKNGKKTYQATGFPGVDKMKEELTKQMK